jgi:hypothetical protein
MKKSLITLGCVATLLSSIATAAACVGDRILVDVRRGDANADRTVNHEDVKTMLAILFEGAPSRVSIRDLDVNMDGRFDIADVHALLADLSAAGPRPAETRAEEALVGDANDDGKLDIADLATLYAWLSGGKRAPAPDAAVDVNEDGRIDIADLVELHRVIGL